MSRYIQVSRGLKNRIMLPETQSVESFIKKRYDEPWYFSPVYYNEAHKEQFDKTRSIAGIRDVYTNNIWVDIDSKDLGIAKQSTIKAAERLMELGLKEHHIQINFSGSKGFHILVGTNQNLHIDEVKAICVGFFSDIEGFDDKVYLPTQIFRYPNTKHTKSDLYGIPLTFSELNSMSTDEIKEMAKTPREKLPKFQKTKMPEELLEFKNFKIEREVVEMSEELKFDMTQLDLSQKPSFIKSNALYALHQGFFRGSESSDSPERKIAFLTLAANFKALGLDKNDNYRLLKSCRDRQAIRADETPFSDKELYEDVLSSVYSSTWKGGTNKEWLDDYRKRYGIAESYSDSYEEVVTTLEEGFGKFAQYISEIDKNTIKTGIKSIDDNIMLLTGRVMGIAAPPSCGKTAVAFQMLSNMSKNGVNSLYCPYDSSSSNVFLTLLMRHTGLSVDELVEKLKDMDFQNKAKQILQRNYPSTRFVWKTTQTCEEIRQTIRQTAQSTGEPVKVVFVDYLELISTEASDETAQTKKAILGLQEIAQEENCLVIVLLQPSKMGTDITRPFTTYNQVKGSSAINQSVSVLISLSRPGHNPQDSSDDIYMSITCLKNKLGSLFSVDLRWDGPRMSIRELEEVERINLKELRSKLDGDSNFNGGF